LEVLYFWIPKIQNLESSRIWVIKHGLLITYDGLQVSCVALAGCSRSYL